MSNRKLVILAIVAVFVVIWAVVQSRIASKPRTEADTLTPLIQGLDPADIGSIVLGVGEDAVTLKRQQGRFVVVNKDNYPAKASEINNLITKCQEIQASEFVTDNPANYEDLEVTEEKARSVVKFLKPDSSILTGVIVGKTKELGQGTYVRLASSDKVYVAPSVPWFGSGAMNYIEQELISVKREDIESVTVSSKDGEYTLKPEADGDGVVLENIPAGKKLKSSDSRNVFTALTNLRFDDIGKKSGELDFDSQYVCRLKDSTVYTLKIAQKDDKTYVSCEADFTDRTPVLIKKEGESEEELKKKEAKLLARDKVKEFSGKHQGWIYEIAEWKAKNLTKKLSDLVEDEEKPKETEKPEDSDAVEPDEADAREAEDAKAIEVDDPNIPKTEDANSVEADS
jgi:hypothetical protein